MSPLCPTTARSERRGVRPRGRPPNVFSLRVAINRKLGGVAPRMYIQFCAAEHASKGSAGKESSAELSSKSEIFSRFSSLEEDGTDLDELFPDKTGILVETVARTRKNRSHCTARCTAGCGARKLAAALVRTSLATCAATSGAAFQARAALLASTRGVLRPLLIPR